MLPDFPRLTRHAPAWFQISRDSQTLTCMLRSPCQTHLTLSCVLPDSPGITDTLLQVSKLYRLNCASRSMLLQVFHFGGAPQLECSLLLSGGGPRLVPDWPQTGPRLAPRLAPDWPQTGPRLAPDWPQTGPRLAPDWLQLVPTWPRLAQIGPRLAPDWPQIGPGPGLQ